MPAPHGAPQAAAAGGAAVLLPPGRAPSGGGGGRNGEAAAVFVPSLRGACSGPVEAHRLGPPSGPRPHPPRPSDGICPSAERGPAVLAARSASPASAATRAEQASRAAPLQATVARVNLNPGCPPLFGISVGSRWGEREPVLPFIFCSSPSPPRSWQRARAAPAVRRAQLPAWLQCAACSSGAGKSPSHAIVRLLSDESDS